MAGDVGDQIQQPDRVRGVDLVPGVARLVIVGVEAGEKDQHRYLSGGERGVVARPVAGLFGEIGVKVMLRGQLFEQCPESTAGTDAAHVNLAVPNAADHIHIDHGHVVFEGQQGMVNVVAGTEQAQFFAREGQEQNAPLVFGLLREPARQFDDARGAGSIIVGAGMDGARKGGRHGELPAQAEMIVMRADDHVLAGFAGQVRGDVVDRFHFTSDIDIQVQAQRFGQGEGFRMQVLIDAALDGFQVLAAQGQPAVHYAGFDLDELDAGIVRAFRASEFLQVVGVARMRADIVDQQHGFGSMKLGVGGLAENLGVSGVDLAFEHALFVELLRLVAQQQYDLAFHIQPRIIVVIVFGRGNPKAREDHCAGYFAGRGKIQRDEILLELQRFPAGGGAISKLVLFAEPRAGGNVEILVITVAQNRLQVHAAKLVADVRRRLFKLRRTGGPAAHFGRCQVLNDAQVFVAADVGGKQSKRGNEQEYARESDREAPSQSHVTYRARRGSSLRSISRRSWRTTWERCFARSSDTPARR